MRPNESEANVCPNESEANLVCPNESEEIMRPNEISIFFSYTRLSSNAISCMRSLPCIALRILTAQNFTRN